MPWTTESPDAWRALVAVGVIADDLHPRAISRYAGVTQAEATRAIEAATVAGVIVDGEVTSEEAVRLTAELPAERRADLHATIASHLIAQGPSHLLQALDHARAAGNTAHLEEIAVVAAQAGRMSLSVSDYASARELLTLADEAGIGESPAERARRLGDLAIAIEGLGMVPEARDVLARAFDLAELAGEAELAAHLATMYAFPADWYAGDVRASALLQRAEALEPSKDARTAILAARSIVEMRIPVATDGRHQAAWVTRPSIAQPLAEEALASSVDGTPETRLLALLAWRMSHRGPMHLARRREISNEALDLAQRLRLPGRQIDAAVVLAVDAIESGDRPQFDRALSVLRWVAERDGNPRLRWHAYTVATGAAFIDADLVAAEEFRTLAREFGMAIDGPGWFGAEMIFLSQVLAEQIDRPDDLHVAWEAARPHIDGSGGGVLEHPIGRMTIAWFRALTGDREQATADLRLGLRRLDHESSLLLSASIGAKVAALLDVPDVRDELIEIMAPYADRVAVDSSVWWCDGPVALPLATLEHARGDDAAATAHLATAEEIAHRMGDVRSLGRIEALRRETVPNAPNAAPSTHDLTDREMQVLRMLVDGATNPEIAKVLSYSPSTIRNDVTSIYRKFGVRNRPEAAARASALGLV